MHYPGRGWYAGKVSNHCARAALHTRAAVTLLRFIFVVVSKGRHVYSSPV